MKLFDILKDSKELLRWLLELVREFRKSPFTAAKALIIFAIIVVAVITQWGGYSLNTGYGWMLGGLVLIVIVLLVTLRLAYRYDCQRA